MSSQSKVVHISAVQQGSKLFEHSYCRHVRLFVQSSNEAHKILCIDVPCI